MRVHALSLSLFFIGGSDVVERWCTLGCWDRRVSSVSEPPLVGRSVPVAVSHLSTVADIAATDWLIAGVLASC